MNTHKRVATGEAKGVCGYWHRGGGLGMTVAKQQLVTCPKCKRLMEKTK